MKELYTFKEIADKATQEKISKMNLKQQQEYFKKYPNGEYDRIVKKEDSFNSKFFLAIVLGIIVVMFFILR